MPAPDALTRLLLDLPRYQPQDVAKEFAGRRAASPLVGVWREQNSVLKWSDVAALLMDLDAPQDTPTVTLAVWKCKTCGCLWRDNLDGFVSLFNAGLAECPTESCEECEQNGTKEACIPFFLDVQIVNSAPADAHRPAAQQENEHD